MTAHDHSGWLTVDQAAARIGVSPATVKRRIQDGKPVRLAGGGSAALEAEMIERPQGHEWRVRLRGSLPPISSDPERTVSESAAPLSSDQQRSESLSAALSASLAALTAALDSERAERQKLAQEARLLAERAARAEALAAAERERREAAERELLRLREWRWWKPATW